MTEQTHIGGVNITAPLWHKAPPDELTYIVKMLSDASFHYADDSGKEWGKGRLALDIAASKCVQLKLSYDALELLYKDKPQLVSFSQFMDHILSGLREARPTAWQPIETTPRDETRFLAYCPPEEAFPKGRMMMWSGKMFHTPGKVPFHLQFPATHWFALPAPPKEPKP